MVTRLLLGPQRPTTNLGDAVAQANIPDAPVAVISAGWQEAEGDIDEIHKHLKQPLVDLRLYHRAEEIFHAEPALAESYRKRQDQLKELQRLYRMRLRQLSTAARHMLRATGDHAMVATERRHAVAQLRALDRHHLRQVQSLHQAFDDEPAVRSCELLAAHTAAAAQRLSGCETVLITGGNVLVLLNRLRLFGMHKRLMDKHLIAWSAGAMVLSDLIVLYHDRTPQGRRDAEVLSDGAGVLPGLVFLPDAQHRLRDQDTIRNRLFSRRFVPAQTVTLDSGSALRFDDERLTLAQNVRALTREGKLTRKRVT